MEAVNNFSGCLKVLENQGFLAEQKLLVQLFGCIETYWKTPVYITIDNPKVSLIEDMQVRLKRER